MEEVKGIKDFGILRFIDKFRHLFEKAGINYNIMRRLLQLMLIMDSRKSITAMAGKANDPKKEVSPFKGYLISYGLIGFLVMISMIAPYPVFYKMSILFGMIIFMVMTTMISDFSSVLLDVKDKVILVPKPIDPKTINAAKTLHIIIYLSIITGIMAGPSLIVGTIIYGVLFFIMFLIQIVFVTVFVIFLTSILYYLILHFFDGEKLKDIINYFQIMLSIVMTVGYQFLGRMFDIVNVNVTFSPKWWTYLIPSVWFAAPYSMVLENNTQHVYIILTALSVAIPVLLFILYSRKVSGYFERNLQKLAIIDRKKAVRIEKRNNLKKKLQAIFCRNNVENAFSRFTNSMIGNERQLKLKLYPTLVYSVIFPFIFMISGITKSKSISAFFNEISGKPFYLLIYVSVMLLSGAFTLLYISENYKGAWIYQMLPVKTPEPIFRGFMRAYLYRCILPVFFFVSVIFCLIYGISLIPHIIAMFLNMIILSIVVFKVYEKNMPFSIEKMTTYKAGGCLIYILAGIYCVLSAGLEFFLGRTAIGLPIYVAVLLIVIVVLWNTCFKIKWSDVYRSV